MKNQVERLAEAMLKYSNLYGTAYNVAYSGTVNELCELSGSEFEELAYKFDVPAIVPAPSGAEYDVAEHYVTREPVLRIRTGTGSFILCTHVVTADVRFVAELMDAEGA